MRILVVCQYYWPEPLNVSETCEELVRRGHEVTVLTGIPNYPSGEIYEGYAGGGHREETLNGVRILRVPIVPRGRGLRGLGKLMRIANYVSFPLSCAFFHRGLEHCFDVALCVQYSPVFMALPALRISRKLAIPCLLWCYDLWPEDMLTGGLSKDGFPYRMARRISRRIYAGADLVAVTSPDFPKYYRDELGLSKIDTVFIPQYAEDIFNGVELVPGRREASGSTVFTFAGNIGGNQAVETIVRAAALLESEVPVVIKVAGSGSRLEKCKQLANELGASNIIFLGRLPLEDMPSLYAASDAMLLTLSVASGGSLVSRYTIPRKFQSYLASGRPVIASADGVVSRIVKNVGCGISCSAESPRDLAGAMASFAALDQKEKRRMGAAARALYEAEYSMDACFDRLEHALGMLISGKGANHGS